jgi:Holliday junction resolvase RusA-like endonuclease
MIRAATRTTAGQAAVAEQVPLDVPGLPPLMVEFDVHARPATQGSKSGYLTSLAVVAPYPRAVRCPRCGVPVRGNINMTEKTKGLADWRAAVAAAARLAMGARPPLHGPLLGYLDIAVARPKDHYRAGRYAHLLKPDAPVEPYLVAKDAGDLSKYARSSEDAMTGIVWADDAQVVEYARLRKHYAGEKRDGLSVPGARIVVTHLG